jgi:predicted Zn-dependent protease
MNFGSMPKIRVHAPTRELGLAVRSAVSKAWDVPCSLFIAQVLPGPGAVDALRALSQVVSSHQVIAPALVLVGAGLTIWGERVFGICREGRALVSLAWLGTGRDLIRRACSVAVHEAGHLLGLGHCNGKCAMRPASSLRDLDKRPLKPCKVCRSLIK